MTPKVSIIFPVYNKEETVKKSLLSGLAQTYENIEVIAVNDGSSDRSLEVIQELKRRNPSLSIVDQANQGLSGARNSGFAASTGEYVIFHDADDIMELDAIELLIKMVLASSPDIVSGTTRRHSGTTANIARQFFFTEAQVNVFANRQHLNTFISYFTTSNKLFRKDFLKENDFLFQENLYMQDIEFWIKCLLSTSRYSHSEAVVSNYYPSPVSASKSRTKDRFESLFMLMNSVWDWCETRNLSQFSGAINGAMLQGAGLFFSKWKLEQWALDGNDHDLRRMTELFSRIPESDYLDYFLRQCNLVIPITGAIRDGNYSLGLQITQTIDPRQVKALRNAVTINSYGDITRLSQNLVDHV